MHELSLNHHRVVKCLASEFGYLQIETEWLNARAYLLIQMTHWPGEDLLALADQISRGTFRKAAYTDDGTLALEFEDGLRLEVPPDPKYEAWEVRCRPGDYTICLPGGGVTKFTNLD